MTNWEKAKIKREWGQWKRRMLSPKERMNLTLGMFIDFLCSKGYEIKTLF